MGYEKAIRVARAVLGISQKELAERARVDPSYVSFIEKGARQPSESTIEALCSALRIPRPLLDLLASEGDQLVGVDEAQAAELGEQLLLLLRDAESLKEEQG